jgi:hypothetical protein
MLIASAAASARTDLLEQPAAEQLSFPARGVASSGQGSPSSSPSEGLLMRCYNAKPVPNAASFESFLEMQPPR